MRNLCAISGAIGVHLRSLFQAIEDEKGTGRGSRKEVAVHTTAKEEPVDSFTTAIPLSRKEMIDEISKILSRKKTSQMRAFYEIAKSLK